jgi:phosphatidylinositol alpha-1,6-mannosyltransferase
MTAPDQTQLFVLTTDARTRGGIQAYTRAVMRVFDGQCDVIDLRSFRQGGNTSTAQLGRVPPIAWLRMLLATIRQAVGLRHRSAHRVVLGTHISLVPFVWLAARIAGARGAVALHGYEAWNPTPLLRGLCRWLHLDYVAVSRFTADGFDRVVPRHRGRVDVIADCIDPEFAGLASLGKPVPPEERYRSRRLLFVGRLDAGSEYKGLGRSIEALARLHQGPRAYELRVIGTGDQQPHYVAQAAACGMDRHVVFLGALSTEQLVAEMHSAALLVMPSVAGDSSGEGFGIAFVEAASCGLPSLAVAAGGATEAVLDGTSGLLLREGSPDEIARSVRALLEDSDGFDTWTRLSQGALRFSEQFSFTQFASSYQRWAAGTTPAARTMTL